MPDETIEEVWFRGCHSDIGGGDGHDQLANIPPVWMMRRAAASGVRFDGEEVKAAVEGRNAATKIVRTGFDKRIKKRSVRTGDRVHCSVAERPKHVNPPTEGCFVVDDLGAIRRSYPGVLTWPFEIDWQGALSERVRLRAGGEPHLADVFARSEWNDTPQVFLEKGALRERHDAGQRCQRRMSSSAWSILGYAKVKPRRWALSGTAR